MRRKLLGIIVIVILFFTYTLNAYAESEADLKSEKDDIKNKQNKVNETLNQITSQKAEEKTALDTINDQVTSLNNEILSLQSQLEELNSSIETKQNEINQKEKEIKEKSELLKKRLVAMYKNGGTSYLDVLLGSGSYLDMLSSFDVVEKIANADTQLINQITDQKSEIEKGKKELEEKKAEIDTIKSEKDAKSQTLKAKKVEKQKQIEKLSEEQKSAQAEIEKYNDAMERVNQKLEEIAKKAEEQIKDHNGGAGLKFDGTFIWPCNNKIVTSRMKWRWGRQHKGIDIGANYESVYATASGYAYNAYDANGYGYYIMIFHGDNYISLYGHLSQRKVSDGQFVKQGQIIATSGGRAGAAGSGSSQGPHLHFELRRASSVYEFFNKSPLDPLDYLPGGYTISE